MRPRKIHSMPPEVPDKNLTSKGLFSQRLRLYAHMCHGLNLCNGHISPYYLKYQVPWSPVGPCPSSHYIILQLCSDVAGIREVQNYCNAYASFHLFVKALTLGEGHFLTRGPRVLWKMPPTTTLCWRCFFSKNFPTKVTVCLYEQLATHRIRSFFSPRNHVSNLKASVPRRHMSLNYQGTGDFPLGWHDDRKGKWTNHHPKYPTVKNISSHKVMIQQLWLWNHIW